MVISRRGQGGLAIIVAGAVIIAIAGSVFFPSAVGAQTEQQREAYRKYMENKKSGASEDEQAVPASIYGKKKAAVPPAPDAAGQTSSDPARFGLDIFSHPPSDMTISTEIPVPSGYTLGPGDRLVINLWGSVERSFNLEIDREGKVFFPKAGDLVLWGLTLDSAQARIEDHIGKIYSDFSMNIVLGKIRSITVYVSGEVARPGAYTVSSLHTMFNILYLAGGPVDRGSLRNIRLIRGNTPFRVIDLYNLLMKGHGDDVRLESNDIIFVPVAGPLVTISGEVRRPAVYELKGEESLDEVIALAGGATPSAYLDNIEILRYEENSRRIVMNVDISGSDDESSQINLIDGDRVTIRSVDEHRFNVVFLKGEVKYPGEYEYVDGMKISDLVGRDILLPSSFLDVVFISRLLEDETRQMIQVDLGKVLFDPSPAGIDKGSLSNIESSVVRSDILLKPGDILSVYSVDRMRDRENVSVEGEVRQPGVYDHGGDMTVTDLIYMAGGVREKAFMLSAEIARLVKDGSRVSEIITFDLGEALAGPHSEADIILYGGDVVYVRKIPKFNEHGKVVISGEVLFSGTYVLECEKETLSDLVRRAGGFTSDAFLKGAVFKRSGIVRELEQRHVFDMVDALREEEFDTSGLSLQPRTRYEVDPVKMSRIIIDLSSIMSGRDETEDIVLKPGDSIYIPGTPSGINVLGAVASSGTIKHIIGKKASFYIERAGGYTRRADKGEIRVPKWDGRVVKKRASSHTMEVGDAIIVPGKIIRDRDWFKVIQSAVSVVAGAFTTIYIVTKL